jgi:hypothetical protein
MSRLLVLFIWVVIILTLIYIYFFHPEVFEQIFSYPGPGSPYVNTPRGN